MEHAEPPPVEDFVDTAHYYEPLLWLTLGTLVAAWVIGTAVAVPFLFTDRFGRVSDLAFFSVWLFGAWLVVKRYQLSEREIGMADRHGPIHALIGALAGLFFFIAGDATFAWLTRGPNMTEALTGARIPYAAILNEGLQGVHRSGVPDLARFGLRYLLPAFVEEIVCRGAMFAVIARRHGPLWATFVSSAVFSALHLDPNWNAFILRAVFGLFMCGLREKTGGLIAPLTAHCLSNTLISMAATH